MRRALICVVAALLAVGIAPVPSLATHGSSHLMTVTLAGDGTGTVTSTPAGIACPPDCSESFSASVTSVSLLATPSTGSTFTSWVGSVCDDKAPSYPNPCVLPMTARRSITATFTAVATSPSPTTSPSPDPTTSPSPDPTTSPSPSSSPPPPSGDQPNVVFIITDDMRADLMQHMPTVMSELVGKGRSFEKGFIVDPVCCPSRTSFLRGQYAHTTSVYDVDGPYGGWAQIREADIEKEMLPVWLDRAGYYTAHAGKYQNGYNALVKPPGWDYWRGKTGGFINNFKFACIAPDPDCPTQSTWQVYSSSNPGYEATEVTRRAVQAIQRSGTAPFFGWFAYFAPHNPVTPEAKYADETTHCGNVDYRTTPSFDEAGTDLVDGMTDKSRWQKGRKPYSASQALSEGRTTPLAACRTLLSVDDGVASILAALEAKDPGLNNTVIVFSSDQGIQYGEHNWSSKRIAYEGTIRVPFVVRADGLMNEQPSTDTQNLVLNIDLAPTVLELAGASGVPGCALEDPFRSSCQTRGGGFDGESFAGLLKGTATPIDFATRTFLIEMSDDGTFPEYCAVRSATSKLVRYGKNNSAADFEAYDLVADPHELHSLVYSGTDGIPRFRPGGQAIYDDLYDDLVRLCSPLPPEYTPFP